MWRRLNREELVATNPLSTPSTGGADTFTWFVYKEYKCEWSNESVWPYLTVEEGTEVKEAYEPLLDRPHLFLDFARLRESKDTGVWDAWISKHGLLGLNPVRPWQFRDTDSWSAGLNYSYKGGPAELAQSHIYEAMIANHALRLYEAAQSQDEAKLEEVLFDGKYPGKENIQVLFDMRARQTGGDRVDVLVDVAVQVLSLQVNAVLSAFAYPAATFGLSRQGLTPKKPQKLEVLTRSLWPRNLLGAMYIQFYWLITSGSEISRCRFCNRIISFAPPVPESRERKARKDKQFCDKRCQQNHYYHTKLKPTRQGKKDPSSKRSHNVP